MNAQHNFYGYRIYSAFTLKPAEGITAAFRYKRYDVAFSTSNANGTKVCIFKDEILVGQYATVESAVAAIDEITAWNASAFKDDAPVMDRHRKGHRRILTANAAH